MQPIPSIMKKALPYLACVLGIVVLVALLPRFNAAQPQGIRLTRSDAVPIADAQARQLGIPVDRSWNVLSWANSTLLDKELGPNAELRRRAADDPVIGPRLGGYKRIYYRRGLEKSVPYRLRRRRSAHGRRAHGRRTSRAEQTARAAHGSAVASEGGRVRAFARISRSAVAAVRGCAPERHALATDWDVPIASRRLRDRQASAVLMFHITGRPFSDGAEESHAEAAASSGGERMTFGARILELRRRRSGKIRANARTRPPSDATALP